MNQIVENVAGVQGLTDQVIATDLLIAAKSGVKNIAMALTETTSPQVRDALTKQLNQAVAYHASVSNYMIEKGYYHPHNFNQQVQVDVSSAQTALNLTNNL